VSAASRHDGRALNVGASRLGAIQPGWNRVLIAPGDEPLLKSEDTTHVWRVPLPSGGHGILKLYRRRGGLNVWRGKLVAFRVPREFEALCVLADGGVPCSQPLLWGWGTAVEHGHFEVLVTRAIPGAASLRERLVHEGGGWRTEDLQPLFPLVRRLHRCGIYHGALSPKNILVTVESGQPTCFYLIDLARAVVFPRAIVGSSMGRFDLLSLLRRLLQLRPETGCERLLRAYGMGDPEISDLLARLGRFRPTHHTRNWLALRFGLEARLARLGRGTGGGRASRGEG